MKAYSYTLLSVYFLFSLFASVSALAATGPHQDGGVAQPGQETRTMDNDQAYRCTFRDWGHSEQHNCPWYHGRCCYPWVVNTVNVNCPALDNHSITIACSYSAPRCAAGKELKCVGQPAQTTCKKTTTCGNGNNFIRDYSSSIQFDGTAFCTCEPVQN